MTENAPENESVFTQMIIIIMMGKSIHHKWVNSVKFHAKITRYLAKISEAFLKELNMRSYTINISLNPHKRHGSTVAL